MRQQLTTIRNYDFYEVSSAMQKAIRRGDEKTAGYFALELFASGFFRYVWKRLLTVSAEDVELPITKEILSLHRSFEIVNTPKPEKIKGRIFISKAVIMLCRAHKSRDMDHLQNLVYDLKIGLPDAAIDESLMDADEYLEIPGYAYDCHTMRGKRSGKTKKDFFLEERECLLPIDNDRQMFDAELHQYINDI
jgi:replication-associated recombination protein RarA